MLVKDVKVVGIVWYSDGDDVRYDWMDGGMLEDIRGDHHYKFGFALLCHQWICVSGAACRVRDLILISRPGLVISTLATITITLIWPNDYDWNTTRAIGAVPEIVESTETKATAAADGIVDPQNDNSKEKDLVTAVDVQAVTEVDQDEEAARHAMADENDIHLDRDFLQKVFWKAAIVSSTMAFIVAIVSHHLTAS